MTNLGKTRGARLPEKLDEKFEEYQEEHSMSKTEAVRSLIEAGLEAEQEGEDERRESFGEVLSKFVLSTLTLFGVSVVGLVLTPLGIGFITGQPDVNIAYIACGIGLFAGASTSTISFLSLSYMRVVHEIDGGRVGQALDRLKSTPDADEVSA
jgi:hypothetical protein